MDFIEVMEQLGAKAQKLIDDSMLATEEATKNALIMPFINALGYNVFDPTEVVPEYVADVGIKKGEKVDYAILKDGSPIIIFECKSATTNLKTTHASQLYRYFTVTPVRIGILTNGTEFRFYSDLIEPNKMDTEPFFTFSILDLNTSHIEQLKKYRKLQFDEVSIISAASEIKYRRLIKEYLQEQLTSPGENFVRLCMQDSKAYEGRFTQTVIAELTPIVRDSLRVFITEQVENRLKSALAQDTKEAADADTVEEAAQEEPTLPLADSGVVTTQEETEAYIIVKSILREVTDSQRVTMRDAKSYCAVLFDDNNRKPICRLHFNGKRLYLGLLDADKNEERVLLESLDDIFKYADQLKATVNNYLAD